MCCMYRARSIDTDICVGTFVDVILTFVAGIAYNTSARVPIHNVLQK